MNKTEQERIEAMLKLGCVACAYLGLVNGQNIECHHLVQGNVRMGHFFSIPLCEQHHRGVNWEALAEVIPKHQRVSIADGRKAFTRVYPIERDLWTTVQERLHLSTAWPLSKVLPRSVA